MSPRWPSASAGTTWMLFVSRIRPGQDPNQPKSRGGQDSFERAKVYRDGGSIGTSCRILADPNYHAACGHWPRSVVGHRAAKDGYASGPRLDGNCLVDTAARGNALFRVRRESHSSKGPGPAGAFA